MENNSDPFAWRTGGKQFNIGEGDEGGIFAMMEIKGALFCVTKKSIHSIHLADSIDPGRTNPSIPDSQKKVLNYGSDDPVVGRTLLQANVLFEKNCLSENINIQKARELSLEFLKEMISLLELKNKYLSEEAEKNSSFKSELGSDSSLKLPSIGNVEQQVKQFIRNIDNASRYVMNLVQIFYPSIENSNWATKLYEEIKKEKGESHPASVFMNSIKYSIWFMRNLRNAVEHPKENDHIEVKDYVLTKEGNILSPTISYKNTDTPLPEIPVSRFVSDSFENLLVIFEMLMAHLCNIHATTFAGDVRLVVETFPENRLPHEAHIRFKYDILWTK